MELLYIAYQPDKVIDIQVKEGQQGLEDYDS